MAVIRNVILDWSGTLVDDLDPVIEACNKIFEAFGKPPFSKEAFREKFFLPFPAFYERYLPEATMEEIERVYHEAFDELQVQVTLLPYALEFLEYCKEQAFSVFLLSSIQGRHFERQSEHLGVRRFFSRAYVEAMDKRRTIQELLSNHDLKPEETLFVGDMEHDIETGRQAGVQSCAVLTGYDSLEKIKQAGPSLIFRDLAGVKGYLVRHRREPEFFPVATVGALIIGPDDRLLMIQTYKWSRLWGIPGGKIKTHERAEDALHREVKEETGLEVEDVRFVTVQDCISSKEFFRPAHFLLLNYLARARSLDVVLNDEADAFCWVTWEEVRTLSLNTPTKILLDLCEPLVRKKWAPSLRIE